MKLLDKKLLKVTKKEIFKNYLNFLKKILLLKNSNEVIDLDNIWTH